MRRRLEQFYAQFGDNGIMFILYAFSLVVNCLLTWRMELPAIHPDEITTIGTAAYLAGKDWTPLLGKIGGGGGYLQAVLYVPLFSLFNNPYAIYKAMLVVNSLLVSFIPLIVYHLAAKLGIVRVRYKLMIAFSCGLYISYIAGSKFVWNEPITALLCWIMVLCVFNAWDKKNKSSRFTMSILLGFLCAAAYAANAQLIGLTLAILVTVLAAHFVLREKVLNLAAFAVSALVSFAAEYFARAEIGEKLWGNDRGLSFNGSLGEFFESLYSGLYAFFTSTLGIGALAAALFVVLTLSLIREGVRRRVDTPESNTRVYEPIKHKYSMRLTLFAIFQFLAIIFSEIFSSVFIVSSKSGDVYNVVSCGENTAPFALFLVLVFVIQYGTELRHVFLASGIYAYSCLCFAVSGSMASEAQVELLNAIVPFSGDTEVSASPMTYLILSSVVFSLYAVIIVFVSCSRKHRSALVSTSVFSVVMLTTAIVGGMFIPALGQRNVESTKPYCDVFPLLCNSPQSPPVVVFDAEPELAGTLQFLAPDTPVSLLERGDSIPEVCLLVTKNGNQISNAPGSYDSMGKTDKYTVYAFGETARDYIRYAQSQSSPIQTSVGTSSATSK